MNRSGNLIISTPIFATHSINSLRLKSSSHKFFHVTCKFSYIRISFVSRFYLVHENSAKPFTDLLNGCLGDSIDNTYTLRFKTM